jgi:hypothetical protein
MDIPAKRRSTSPTRTAGQGLRIVVRDRVELYHTLHHEFGDIREVSIIHDRRTGARRREALAGTVSRRGTERRSLPRIEDDLRLRHYA